MKLSWWKALASFFLAAVLSIPAMAIDTAYPGTLNFIEGKASIQNQLITPKSVGSTDLKAGQTLATTSNGRAEVLLTPGVFLRLDHDTAVKMISPSLTDTKVDLERGRAEVEVSDIHKENNLQVQQGRAVTRMVKKGLYAFSDSPERVRVFKGEVHVADGDHRMVKVTGGHELLLDTSGRLKARKFDKKLAEGDFYNWSKLRSKYLSEASANAAQVYVMNGWVGPGWYWDPWFDGFAYLPGSGVLYSPFGFGYYGLGYPYYGFGFGFGDYDRGPRFDRDFGGDRDFARGHEFVGGHVGDRDDFHGAKPGFFRFRPSAPPTGRIEGHTFQAPAPRFFHFHPAAPRPMANFGGFHGTPGFHGGPAMHR
jgi:hypothetical protein